MIRRVTENERIPQILELAKRITIWDFSLQELAIFLETQITSPGLLVLLDDDNRCFTISSVYRDMVTPYVCIMFAWSDPKYPDITVKEVEMIKDWARSYGITEIKICVRKNVKAFMKKYGFTIDGILLRMEVDNG